MRYFRCPLCGQTGIPGAHRCPPPAVGGAVAAPAPLIGPALPPPPAWKDNQRLNEYTSNMATDNSLRTVRLEIREKYRLARYNLGIYSTAESVAWWNDNNGPGGTTIAQFRQMNRAGQLAIIDAMWQVILLLFPANSTRSGMVDPASVSQGRGIQPSRVRIPMRHSRPRQRHRPRIPAGL